MYFAIVQQFIKTLKNLDTIMQKAQHHAEAKKFDPSNLCGMRLAPDMFPLTRQVQVACDTAKMAAASLCGKTPPKHEDGEKSLVELRTRIQTVVAYLETFHAEDFAAIQATQPVKILSQPGKAMHAQDALISRAVPNFFFHVVTAYDLLRSSGVEIGKTDYLGQLKFIDA